MKIFQIRVDNGDVDYEYIVDAKDSNDAIKRALVRAKNDYKSDKTIKDHVKDKFKINHLTSFFCDGLIN